MAESKTRFLLWLFWFAQVSSSLFAAEPDLLCGVNCLYVGLQSLDVESGSYSEFLKKHGEVDLRGLSFGELGKIAESYSVSTLAVQTSLENLTKRKGRFACIAHVDGQHFVNILSIEKDAVEVVDPPNSGKIAKSVFLKRWDGRALLISAHPLESEESLNQPSSRWLWIATSLGVAITMAYLAWKVKHGSSTPA